MLNFFRSILFFLLSLNLHSHAQKAGNEHNTSMPERGSAIMLNDRSWYIAQDIYKEASEKPFSIEAVYEFDECSATLVSIDVHNAHFPLSWYELNETGQRIHVLFNPQLNHLNNHTTYVVEDMSAHTDTIYINFQSSLAIRRIYPNPHRDVLHIDYSAIEPEPLDACIYDMAGRMIARHTYLLQKGPNQMVLNMSSLEQGTYLLSLNGLCINQLHKIIHLEQ